MRPHLGPKWLATTLALLGSASLHAGDPPFADIHLHWKWNQKEVTTTEQAAEILRAQHIGLAVVTGTPPALALELQEQAPERVIPIYGLYRLPGEWSTWHRDDGLLDRVRAALQSGRYHGIGEVHMLGGFISHWQKPTIAGLFDLAAEFDVPVLLHTEFSRADYTLGVCRAHPDTRFLWAHAGSMLPPDEVRRVLDGCPNVHAELSARDPWRHRANLIVDTQGRLLPAWRSLIVDFADRFMVGSDPVWPVDRLNPWDEPDSGWIELPRFVAFHRAWLDELPTDLAEAIRWGNARRFFAKALPAEAVGAPGPAT
ncbi:MAG: amidohydrolase family protein [Gammaproteobacteria bacterium]|nr:amidohydrolase family protein [Gammaproteobacteria bacterium]